MLVENIAIKAEIIASNKDASCILYRVYKTVNAKGMATIAVPIPISVNEVKKNLENFMTV